MKLEELFIYNLKYWKKLILQFFKNPILISTFYTYLIFNKELSSNPRTPLFSMSSSCPSNDVFSIVMFTIKQSHSSEWSGQCSIPSHTWFFGMHPPVWHLNWSRPQSHNFSSSPLAHSLIPLQCHVNGMHHFSVGQRYSSFPQLSAQLYSSRWSSQSGRPSHCQIPGIHLPKIRNNYQINEKNSSLCCIYFFREFLWFGFPQITVFEEKETNELILEEFKRL